MDKVHRKKQHRPLWEFEEIDSARLKVGVIPGYYKKVNRQGKIIEFENSSLSALNGNNET